MRRLRSTEPAYTLVDVSSLPDDVRKDVVADAMAGGREYGVTVVETMHNGPAQAQIFGVYKDVKDKDGKLLNDSETRWAQAKEDLGLVSTEVDDSEVVPMGGAAVDPRTEAALREAAAERVNSVADAIRAGEEANINEIVGTDAPHRHTSNIVDDRAIGADIATAIPEPVIHEDRTAPAKPAKPNKAPK